MTPQHSSPPGRAFRFGMFARLYRCMKCYLKHAAALDSRLNNVSLRGATPVLSVSSGMVRYCFNCFEKRLIYLGHHLFGSMHSCPWMMAQYYCAPCALDPPGSPPWCNFTNYSNTKNRPFINPSSWAVPVTWRSSERK